MYKRYTPRLKDLKIGSAFKKVKSACYKNHENGFYVYAKPNKCDLDKAAKYIGRYLGRPVISTSRIDSYDGESATFHYSRYEDEKLIAETFPVLEFTSRLAQHIPEKHFKQIRYYGIYARHWESGKKLNRAAPKEKHKTWLLRFPVEQ